MYLDSPPHHEANPELPIRSLILVLGVTGHLDTIHPDFLVAHPGRKSQHIDRECLGLPERFLCSQPLRVLRVVWIALAHEIEVGVYLEPSVPAPHPLEAVLLIETPDFPCRG